MTYYIQVEHQGHYVGMFTIKPDPFHDFMTAIKEQIFLRWPTLKGKNGLHIDICTQLPKPVYR